MNKKEIIKELSRIDSLLYRIKVKTNNIISEFEKKEE